MKNYNCLYLILLLFAFSACDITVAGDDGLDGSANVISNTYTLALSNFKEVSEDNSVAYFEFDIPSLTQRVAQEGVVLSYMGSDDTWFALPFSFQQIHYTFEYKPEIFLFAILSEDEQAEEHAGSVLGSQIRVVTIPPSDTLSVNHVDQMNYEAVRHHFNLE